VDPHPLTIEDVNALDERAFLARFGHVYEDTPSLAAAVWCHRPFADRDALVTAFTTAAERLDDEAELALLRAHPQLAVRGPMGTVSSVEQRTAGLTTGSDEVLATIRDGNERYLRRFGFPFVIAVRGLTPTDVAAALTDRIGHHPRHEQAEAMRQVRRIARLRVERLVGT
jgi:2-oxo-4-hydroxy-4-carboxy-5-ureidoimidazoline decarboxylase